MRTSFHLRSAPCRWWLGVSWFSCEVRPPSWARRSIPVPLNGPRLARWECGMMSVTFSLFSLGAGEFLYDLYAYSASVCVNFCSFIIVFICRWIVSFVFTSVFLKLLPVFPFQGIMRDAQCEASQTKFQPIKSIHPRCSRGSMPWLQTRKW